MSSLRTFDMHKVRKLVSKKGLKSDFGIPYCFAHIKRLEDAGKFPRRINLGACRVAWFEDEVEQWIAERAALRDADTRQLERSF
jgi:prophage regulatory protein